MACTKPRTVADAVRELGHAVRGLEDVMGMSAPAEVAVPAPAVLVVAEEPRRRGRRIAAGEGAVGEPLLGLAEATGPCLGGCGAPPAGAASPTAIAFERAVQDGEGFAFEPLHTAELPGPLASQYAAKAPSQCLPWVRVERDPARYSACLARAQRLGVIDGPKQIWRLVHDFLNRQDQEVFLAVLLDTHRRVRGVSEVTRGSRDRVAVPVPDVLRIVVVEGARGFVVVHNHPSGEVRPSGADVELTRAMAEAARAIDVPLFDHVIVAGSRYFSFADDRRLRTIVSV